VPEPGPGEILARVSACGICRTDLDEVEGRVRTKLPVIPGHQIVGTVERAGPGATKHAEGDRVGVAWIYSACGRCRYCREGRENLCHEFRGTGCDADGGYAEYVIVPEESAYPVPKRFSDAEAAPLLCAGAIGYRALKLSGMRDGEVLGLYGYGASAHIIHQVVGRLFPSSKVFVFTRERGDPPSELAKRLGAHWVGATGEAPPERLSRAIDTTPAGAVVREALGNLERGGRLVVNVIAKESPIPELDYVKHLWREREVRSVTNITRADVREFLSLIADIPIELEITRFRLEEANEALLKLKRGMYRGAGVLVVRP